MATDFASLLAGFAQMSGKAVQPLLRSRATFLKAGTGTGPQMGPPVPSLAATSPLLGGMLAQSLLRPLSSLASPPGLIGSPGGAGGAAGYSSGRFTQMEMLRLLERLPERTAKALVQEAPALKSVGAGAGAAAIPGKPDATVTAPPSRSSGGRTDETPFPFTSPTPPPGGGGGKSKRPRPRYADWQTDPPPIRRGAKGSGQQASIVPTRRRPGRGFVHVQPIGLPHRPQQALGHADFPRLMGPPPPRTQPPKSKTWTRKPGKGRPLGPGQWKQRLPLGPVPIVAPPDSRGRSPSADRWGPMPAPARPLLSGPAGSVSPLLGGSSGPPSVPGVLAGDLFTRPPSISSQHGGGSALPDAGRALRLFERMATAMEKLVEKMEKQESQQRSQSPALGASPTAPTSPAPPSAAQSAAAGRGMASQAADRLAGWRRQYGSTGPAPRQP